MKFHRRRRQTVMFRMSVVSLCRRVIHSLARCLVRSIRSPPGQGGNSENSGR